MKTVEPPEVSEGFAALEVQPFVRRPWPDGVGALFVGLELLASSGAWLPEAAQAIAADAQAPVVLLGWKEGGVTARVGADLRCQGWRWPARTGWGSRAAGW